MSKVDPDDDSVRRFVVRRYTYDPDRHERRHVALAAYDDEREFTTRMDLEVSELRARRARGAADPQERISGSVHEAGYSRRAAAVHVVRSCIAHGVCPTDAMLLAAEGAPGHRVTTFRPAGPEPVAR